MNQRKDLVRAMHECGAAVNLDPCNDDAHRAFAAARAALRKWDVAHGMYHCPLCGQRIDDGKPCGCGAR